MRRLAVALAVAIAAPASWAGELTLGAYVDLPFAVIGGILALWLTGI
ncbi:MAG TPA: hypothetical protein VLX30_10415 [Burkholderiales bacterium]|nr:hypothetical protein [Burkholderiales bacterium]